MTSKKEKSDGAFDVNGVELFANDPVVSSHLHGMDERGHVVAVIKKRGLVEVRTESGHVWRGAGKLWRKVT